MQEASSSAVSGDVGLSLQPVKPVFQKNRHNAA
jgi:hypothetical protein